MTSSQEPPLTRRELRERERLREQQETSPTPDAAPAAPAQPVPAAPPNGDDGSANPPAGRGAV